MRDSRKKVAGMRDEDIPLPDPGFCVIFNGFEKNIIGECFSKIRISDTSPFQPFFKKPL